MREVLEQIAGGVGPAVTLRPSPSEQVQVKQAEFVLQQLTLGLVLVLKALEGEGSEDVKMRLSRTVKLCRYGDVVVSIGSAGADIGTEPHAERSQSAPVEPTRR